MEQNSVIQINNNDLGLFILNNEVCWKDADPFDWVLLFLTWDSDLFASVNSGISPDAGSQSNEDCIFPSYKMRLFVDSQFFTLTIPFRSIHYSFWGLTSYNNVLYTLGNTRMLRL